MSSGPTCGDLTSCSKRESSSEVAPLLIPRWGSTRGWSSLTEDGSVRMALGCEVDLDDANKWQQRRLSSAVLRSRRKGRSAAGGLKERLFRSQSGQVDREETPRSLRRRHPWKAARCCCPSARYSAPCAWSSGGRRLCWCCRRSCVWTQRSEPCKALQSLAKP